MAAGSDADIVIYDPNEPHEVRIDRLISRAAGCARAFEGMKLRGTITHTLVNGAVVYDRGTIADEPHGRFVGPQSASVATAA